MAANPIAPTVPEVRETARAQMTPRTYTYDDFLALPNNGKRYEIIEGILYMANAPSYDHQYVSMMLSRSLINHVVEHGLGIVLAAPFEVHLAEDTRPVQPDVLFISTVRQPKAGAKYFEGVPDLIVEVISPSSLRLDRVIKFAAYEKAGVTEYWIADPKTRSIEVYVLTQLEDGMTEYVLLGSFVPGEMVQSSVLSGIELATQPMFASA